MRGTYCIVASLDEDSRIRVGSLGTIKFRAGIYVYVGSALSGIEKRVSRHKSPTKKRRWHIDYLLDRADVLSAVAIPSERRSTECEVLQALSSCEGATIPVPGFGSSDCGCESHLLYFDEADPEWIAEVLLMRLSMLQSVYQRRSTD